MDIDNNSKFVFLYYCYQITIEPCYRNCSINNNNHLYSHILEYIKYPNRAIQCTKFLTITIQDKVCYKACNAINFMK